MNIQELFSIIRKDFVKTDSDIFITILLAVSFFTMLVLSSWLINFINKKRIVDKYRDTYRGKIREMDLTINEIDLINKLSAFLKQPWKKYLLLTNYHTFIKCRNKYNSETDDDNRFIESLENKILNYTSDFDKNNIYRGWNNFEISVKDSLYDENEYDKNVQDIFIKKEHSKKNPVKAEVVLLNKKRLIITNKNIQLKVNEDVRIFIQLKGNRILRINGEVKSINRISKKIVILFNHI